MLPLINLPTLHIRRKRDVFSSVVSAYIAEEWSDEEADVLRRYFTNLDQPVFALVNLPEVVKGALFARYSRSSKSLRRLFLDEFLGDLDIEGCLLYTSPSPRD